MIGNDQTLLPDRLNENGEPYHVWTCWDDPPDNLDALLERPALWREDPEQLRAEWLCGPGNPRRKTGTPLALDAPYPYGHPLAGRN